MRLSAVESLTTEEREAALKLSPLPQLPPDPTNKFADDDNAAALGRVLFFDKRLSADGTRSCATCHQPDKAFTDGRDISDSPIDHDRNTPTVLNAAYLRWLFSDGSADSLWAQALRPIESDREMASDRGHVAALVLNDPDLRTAYEAVFGPPPTIGAIRNSAKSMDFHARPPFVAGERRDHAELRRVWEGLSNRDQLDISRVFANVGKAIEAYERRLVTGPSPFDEFIAGLRANDAKRMAAIPPDAIRGLKLFVGRANCVLCHSGPLLTDREFHNIGVPDRGSIQVDHPGRLAGIDVVLRDPFNGLGVFSDAVEGKHNDKLRYLGRPAHAAGAFKTPSLRNVALTAPYMRQGQFKTLEEVVRFYSTLDDAAAAGHGHRETILRPLNLTEREQADLVAFLRSLTGTMPAKEWVSPP
ncbi:MAG: hypothetical protein KDA32_09335 [Phycisphaerales bacterium]|nr:hypothetical protein [Phycisphaerales bacterium]